jgi:micrococcal nuclease
VLCAAVAAGLAVGLYDWQLPSAVPSVNDAIQPGLPRASGARNDGVRAAASASSGQVFGFCHSGGGTNCVVDGDTFWIGGEKVRIAGIDAPETHPPRCAEEARLGEAATERLQALLNSGAVTMTRIDRDRDRYGRPLAAGVAREYGSGRRGWS